MRCIGPSDDLRMPWLLCTHFGSLLGGQAHEAHRQAHDQAQRERQQQWQQPQHYAPAPRQRAPQQQQQYAPAPEPRQRPRGLAPGDYVAAHTSNEGGAEVRERAQPAPANRY